jgi:hypothetical protein
MQSTPTDREVVVQLALMLRKRLDAKDFYYNQTSVEADVDYWVADPVDEKVEPHLECAQAAVGDQYALTYHSNDECRASTLRLAPAAPRE